MKGKEPKRLFDFPRYQLANCPLKDSLANKINGVWTPVSTKEYVDLSEKASRAFIEMGIQPGDKVAIASTTNRWEWNIIDIGTLQTGAVDVPVYPTISEDDYEYIFNDAAVKMLFVSDEALYEKVMHIKEKVASLIEIYTFDEVKGAPSWLEFLAKGEDDKHQVELQQRMDAVQETDLATLIYTSGTTGRPKGVMLSHRNIASNSLASVERIPTEGSGERALSFLPLCHVYERMLIYLYCYQGVAIYYAESMEMIGDNIRELKPTIFTAVPRLLEKIYDKIVAKGSDLTGIKRKLFFWAIELGEQYELEGKGFVYGIKLAIARKLIFSKWQEALGGRTKAIASGSAALNPRLIRIFSAAGINIQEGYGLTETSPVITVNGPDKERKRIGSVGRLIADVEVKIAEDGEILCKGPNVMMGYYNKPEATAEVLTEDGWFHTGDIGQFVDGDFLKITDRKKEIFKTSGGKYIAPQLMETRFKESHFIEQIMVIGEAEKHPAAIVQPDFVFLKSYCERKGINFGSEKEIIENEEIKARIMQDINRLNENFGKWEMVKKIELSDHTWSIDGGELTPTLKLKRRVVMALHQDHYERIYGHKKGE
ncbi:MAG: long-chain fatty acid--CoA ligase [Bacteroidetes bacterium]|nr:MAG: long-chain fatty acid--CoA ligase [Bacteroidota bacterium]